MNGSKNLFGKVVDRIGCELIGRQFFGGSSVPEVLQKGEELKRLGYSITYNLLGEHIVEQRIVELATETMLTLMKEMTPANSGNISIKPSLFGLEISQNLYHENVKTLMREAKLYKIGIEADAETRSLLEPTYEVFSDFASDLTCRGFIRQAVQAHWSDIHPLMDKYKLWDKGIRVVKGAGVYPENPGTVVHGNGKVKEQYLSIVRRNHYEGQVPYVATVRDRDLICEVMKILPSPYMVEFEMLYGLLGKDVGAALLAKPWPDAENPLRIGWPVHMYLPFVDHWRKDAWREYGSRRSEMMRRLFWKEMRYKLKNDKGCL
jgi:proline dehydrogenase